MQRRSFASDAGPATALGYDEPRSCLRQQSSCAILVTRSCCSEGVRSVSVAELSWDCSGAVAAVIARLVAGICISDGGVSRGSTQNGGDNYGDVETSAIDDGITTCVTEATFGRRGSHERVDRYRGGRGYGASSDHGRESVWAGVGD